MVTTAGTAQGATGTAQGAPPPVVVPASQYLDNTVPNTTKRTENEVLVLSVVVSKQDRATVRVNDKKTFQKLEEKARKNILIRNWITSMQHRYPILQAIRVFLEFRQMSRS